MSSSVLTRPRPEYRSADLLTAYLPGSFYYSSPRGTVLADGVSRAVRADTGRRAEAVSAALASAREDGVPDPIAVGALGFLPTS